MDAGKMSSPEATVILGAAVIDDVMGLFVLAFLAASADNRHNRFLWLGRLGVQLVEAAFRLCGAPSPLGSNVAHRRLRGHLLCRFLWRGKALARSAHPAIAAAFRQRVRIELRLALVLIYAIAAEWLGSVAGITGAYLLGYVFAGSEYKADIERTFYAIGHGLLIPMFFVSIGLSSNFRSLGGHWLLLGAIFLIAVVSKLLGCGVAALARGMGLVRSFRVGCGMVSRGEVGLIVTAMGAASGVFREPEVAVMVSVVLFTTLLTPLALRGAFHIKCRRR